MLPLDIENIIFNYKKQIVLSDIHKELYKKKYQCFSCEKTHFENIKKYSECKKCKKLICEDCEKCYNCSINNIIFEYFNIITCNSVNIEEFYIFLKQKTYDEKESIIQYLLACYEPHSFDYDNATYQISTRVLIDDINYYDNLS